MSYESRVLEEYIRLIANGEDKKPSLDFLMILRDRLNSYETFEQTNGWIPVDQYMPAKNEWVDVWAIHANNAPPGRWTNVHFCHELNEWAGPSFMSVGTHVECPKIPGKVTHWRPIMKGPNNE